MEKHFFKLPGIAIIAAMLVFFSSDVLGQSVKVTIHPTPVILATPTSTNCDGIPSYSTGACINNVYDLTQVISGATLSGNPIDEGTGDEEYQLTFYSDKALNNPISSSFTPTAEGCTDTMYAKVTVNGTGCYSVYEFTLDVKSPALTLSDDEKSTCVANQIDLIDAFIDLEGFSNYTYTTKEALAGDLTFYHDNAGTNPLPAVNYLYTPTAADLSNGSKKIYARLNNGTCLSIMYEIILTIYEEPAVTLTIATDTASVCFNTSVDLTQYATATPGNAILQFSTSSDFSDTIASPTNYTPASSGSSTIYVRAVNRNIDLPCETSAANIKNFTLTVYPAITVNLAVGGKPGEEEAELCQEELTGDTGTNGDSPILKLVVTMTTGGSTFTELYYQRNSETPIEVSLGGGQASPYILEVPAVINDIEQTYTIVYAKDENGCEYGTKP